MTGYQSKKKAAQDKLAQPAQEFNRTWVCNECGSQQFTSAICEADLDYLACSNCGGNEFHKEALAQPEQEPVATVQCIHGITIGYLEIMQPVGTKLYTAPPQRPWVGLTNEDFSAINQSCFTKLQAAASAESILKEKNNG